MKKHTSYLSFLVHRHIIQACKKYTKKWVNSRQKKQQIGQNGPIMLGRTQTQKSTPPPVVEVVTNMSYAKKTLWNFSEYLPKVTGIWCANASGKPRNFSPFSVFFLLFCRNVRHFPNLKRKSVIGNEKSFQTYVLVRVQTILVWVFWVTAIRISVSYEIELSVAELKRVRIIHAPCNDWPWETYLSNGFLLKPQNKS